MENKEHFGALTERMQAFREEVLDEKPYIDAERALLATEAYRANQNQPQVMKRALMLQKILENMSIYIEDKTLIVGNQATKNCNAPIFPEYTMKFVMDELDKFEKLFIIEGQVQLFLFLLNVRQLFVHVQIHCGRD